VALHGLTAEADPKHQALSQAINAGTSVREAAGLAGVAVATAMAWAAEAGIRTPRRPKHFTADKRSLAISRLMRGQDKARVAEATGVSIQTITLLLRTTLLNWQTRSQTVSSTWARSCRS
jgi:transposase